MFPGEGVLLVLVALIRKFGKKHSKSLSLHAFLILQCLYAKQDAFLQTQNRVERKVEEERIFSAVEGMRFLTTLARSTQTNSF